jgi:hypothetical protein
VAVRRSKRDPKPSAAPVVVGAALGTLMVERQPFPPNSFPSLWESLGEITVEPNVHLQIGIALGGGVLYLLDKDQPGQNFMEKISIADLCEQWAAKYVEQRDARRAHPPA